MSGLDFLINLVILVFVFWLLSNIYIFIIFIFNSFGIKGILFDWEFFPSDYIGYGFRVLITLSNIFLCVMLSFLWWIFVLWMIIIIFVPFIIIIPIPFIPFFIPIPLKFLMLAFIPPFRTLTERGILPWVLRLVLIFISADSIKSKFSQAFSTTYGVFYDDIRNIIGDILGKPTLSVTYNENDVNKVPNVDEGTDNKELAKKEINDDNSGRNKKVMDLINEELELCIKSKQAFTLPNSKTGALKSAQDMKNYSECYAKSVKSYLDNKL